MATLLNDNYYDGASTAFSPSSPPLGAAIGDYIPAATFYIEAIEATTITLSKVGSPTVGSAYYGINDTSVPNLYTYGNNITLSAGQKCYWTITSTTAAFSVSNYLKFTSTGRINVGGNLSDLIGGNTAIPRDYCFYGLFYQCDKLVDASNLVIVNNFNFKTYCYYNMFRICTSLTTAPQLPATTLATGCYYNMFYNCTSLTTVPQLPATTLATECYYRMFEGCTSLTSAPQLPATTLADSCYYRMFYGCTNIKLSATQTGIYQKPYRIPSSGTGIVGTNSLTLMFSSTGGTFKDTPTINTTYYMPYPVSITYNGNFIAGMESGIKTLNCSEKYMNGNIVIDASKKVEVTYESTVLYTAAGTKTLSCANKIMSGNVIVRVAVEKISVPTLTSQLTYNGLSQSPTWSGYDSNKMTIGGTAAAINAGTYTVTFIPKDGYAWDDAGSDVSAKSVSWTMARAAISTAKPGASTSATYTGSAIGNGYTTPTYINVSGSTSGTNAGTYTATYTPDNNHCWSDGTTSAVSRTLTINKANITITTSSTSYNLASGSSKSIAFSTSPVRSCSISSNNTSICAISSSSTSSTGFIAAWKGVGSTTITISFAGDSNVNAGSTTIAINCTGAFTINGTSFNYNASQNTWETFDPTTTAITAGYTSWDIQPPSVTQTVSFTTADSYGVITTYYENISRGNGSIVANYNSSNNVISISYSIPAVGTFNNSSLFDSLVSNYLVRFKIYTQTGQLLVDSSQVITSSAATAWFTGSTSTTLTDTIGAIKLNVDMTFTPTYSSTSYSGGPWQISTYTSPYIGWYVAYGAIDASPVCDNGNPVRRNHTIVNNGAYTTYGWGAVSTIYATSTDMAVMNATNGSTTVAGQWSDGRCTIYVPSAGSWTVGATAPGITTTFYNTVSAPSGGSVSTNFSFAVASVRCTLIGVAAKDFPNGSWVTGINNLGNYGTFSISGTQISTYTQRDKQIISYFKYEVITTDGRVVPMSAYSHDANSPIVITTCSYHDYGSGDGVGGGNFLNYNSEYKNFPSSWGAWTTATFTISTTMSDTTSLYAFGSFTGAQFYTSNFNENLTHYFYYDVQKVKIRGIEYVPTLSLT